VGSLKGKVAVVTGASRGVGRHIAVRLAQRGAAVALLARSEAGLEDTLQQLAAHGARALSMPIDLGKPESMQQVKGVI
jgi:short-subunit dehydrogenase